MIMQSPDDYDFDDPKYQAELDRLLDRLAARRRADRSRFEDPLTRLLDATFGNPHVRHRPQEEEAQEPVKPLPDAPPAASIVEELRANLGKRKGARRGRKVQQRTDAPTLDIELIERMFQSGATLAQIRAHLRVGAQTLKLELLTHLPHVAEEASKRRGRKPKEIDIGRVRQMREEGMALHLISETLGVSHNRLLEAIGAEPSLKKRLGSVDTASVLRLHAEGLTQAQIAAALGCCDASVYRRLKQARLDDKAVAQQTEETKVKTLRDQGWGWRRIAVDLKVCHKRLMRQYQQRP